MKHVIDATNRSLGRVASEAAVLLMGKNEPTLKKNVASNNIVHIENASKAKISINKLENKKYIRYSGYPGGQTIQKMAHVIEHKGHTAVFEQAVYGMLPPNKLRPKMMKHLKITE